MSTILIVEDDGLLAFDLEHLVREQTGAEVVVAHTLRAARAALVQIATITCALIDIELPDGTSFDFARELATRQISFAFLSGNPRSGVPEDLSTHPFLPKPYRRTEIVRMLQEACESPAVQGEKRQSWGR